MTRGSYRNVERLRAIVEKALTRVDSTLDYPRTIEAIEKLANVTAETETDENVWYLGDFGYSLYSILVGSYWHLTEWHGGQWSATYRAMCAVGVLFNPGCTNGPEPESCEMDVYRDLETMARAS